MRDAEQGAKLARDEFERRVLQATYRDLSDVDVRFLEAMLADDGDSSMTDIAKRLGVSSSYASKYKSRLLEQGIIAQGRRGWVRFELPGFRDYAAKLHNGQA